MAQLHKKFSGDQIKILFESYYTGHISRTEIEQPYGWLDENPEAALAGVRNVVADAVKDMKANGETPPETLSSKCFSGKFMLRIPP
jgi:hypothetical protein